MAAGRAVSTEIDHAHLAAQTGGDTSLARELLDLFAGQCGSLVPKILDPALPAADRADAAHTLRGSAAGIGAPRVAAACETLEAGLRATGSAAPEALAVLTAAAEAAVAEIGRRG